MGKDDEFSIKYRHFPRVVVIVGNPATATLTKQIKIYYNKLQNVFMSISNNNFSLWFCSIILIKVLFLILYCHLTVYHR